MHLFNQSNRKSTDVLHNSTLYALCILLLKGTTQYPSFLKTKNSKQIISFLKKILFKKFHLFTNQIIKVRR